MTIEMDILYEPDPQKKKILAFNTPTGTMSYNGASTNFSVQDNGFVYTIQNAGEVYDINFSVYPYDPYSGNTNQVSYDDDEYNYSVSFSIIPNTNSMPMSLILIDNQNGTCSISGSISNILKDVYKFLLRASLLVTDKSGNYIRTDDTDLYMYFDTPEGDDAFYWNIGWLQGVPSQTVGNSETSYVLGKIPKGGNMDMNIYLTNPNNYNIDFSFINVESNDLVSQQSIVPANIKIDKIDNQTALVGGNVDLTIDTSNGNITYYFGIQAKRTDIDNSYGSPDTRTIIFEIDVLNYFDDSQQTSDSITWVTPSGSIGSTYEYYYSHFGVTASNPLGNTITYMLAPGSNLPSGLQIDKNTGYITGRCPPVVQSTDYYFIIRAYCGTTYSDRLFYLTILPCYSSPDFFDVYIQVTSLTRLFSSSYAWNTNCVPGEKVFRFTDSNFGHNLEPLIYVVSGLQSNNNTTGFWDVNGNTISQTDIENITTQASVDAYRSCLVDKLRNYHHPFDLAISGIQYSPGYDPSGNYVYDVIYLTLTDFSENDFSFFDNNEKEILVEVPYNFVNGEAPELDVIPTTTRVCSPSIRNCRLDLINTSNRITSPTLMIKPNATPGIGLTNSEGMPFWMKNISPITKTSLGYVCAIPLVYVVPGYGETAIINYEQNGISELYGKRFTVDRYLVYENYSIRTHFDLNNDNGTETMFDVQDTTKKYITGTWFDVIYEQETRYIVFPRSGDSD